MPLVTIGIPTYRRPQLLERAVRSALAQDHSDIEVVVSDNASGDTTPEVIRGIADPRVRFLEQPENRGSAVNFWAVLEAARGAYFMWLGDDDWIDPTYLTACLRLLAPDVAIAGGIARNYRAGVFENESAAMEIVDDDPARRVLAYYRTVQENPIFYGVMRTDVIRSCKLTHTLGSDWLLIAQLAVHGKLRTAADTRLHRERDNSASASLANTLRTLRLSSMLKRAPATAIASAAARDITGDTVFARLPARDRALLAPAVSAIILARMGLWRRLRAAIGRERASRWWRGVTGPLRR